MWPRGHARRSRRRPAPGRRERPRRSSPRSWRGRRSGRRRRAARADPRHRSPAVAGDLGLGVAVEIDGDVFAFAYEREMVPGLGRDLRLAGEDLAGVVAGGKEEPARGDLRSADAELVARCSVGALGAERKEIAGDRPGVGRQAVPEPELDAVGIANAVELGLEEAPREMHGAVDRSCRRRDRRASGPGKKNAMPPS